MLIMRTCYMLNSNYALDRNSCVYRNAAILGFALLTAQVCVANTSALAQTGQIGSQFERKVLSQQKATPPRAPDTEITVTAKRRGDADVASENEFDEAFIASQGVDDIQSLLSRLQIFIDPTGQPPVLLINGKEIGFDLSILAYPPEALTRVAVLKPEAGSRYGTSSSQRVVNLVLKPKFSSLEGGGALNAATAGGQLGEDIDIARFAINGDMRWTAKVRAGHQSSLLKSSRNSLSSGTYDSIGFVTGINGGEIDPSLSEAAGEVVKFAAIGSSAAGPPTLADFIISANRRNPINPDDFVTLQGSSRNYAVGLGGSHPIGNFSASLSLDVSRSENEGLNGIPMMVLLLPPGTPWSPFNSIVVLNRPLAGTRALRSNSSVQSISTTFTLTGRIYGVQTSLAFGYSHSGSRNRQETGVSTAALQQQLDIHDPTLNPYKPLGNEYLEGIQSRSSSDSYNARINLQKSLITLPTGALIWSASANAGHARSHSARSDLIEDDPANARTNNGQWSGQTSLNVPLSRRGSKFSALGDFLLDLTVGRGVASRSSGQNTFGVGLTWRPIPQIQMNGLLNCASFGPSFSQITKPIVTTINRIFDFRGQEMADPIWITGGNPELNGRHSRVQNLTVNLTVTPLSQHDLALNFGYRQSSTTGGTAEFPELTPAVEAAFPQRIIRDAAGRLVSVDARPIGIEGNRDADLNSTLTLRFGGSRKDDEDSDSGRDPLQFSLSLSHQFRLRDETVIRHGLPTINRLNDDSGTSRHMVDLQFGAGEAAFGSNITVNWRSPSRVNGEDATFRVTPPLLFHLSAFINPDQLVQDFASNPLTKKLKISFSITNLFNRYRRVTYADYSTPEGYSHDEVDPLGRTVLITFRKQL